MGQLPVVYCVADGLSDVTGHMLEYFVLCASIV
jgi:hypothetical protein